MYVPHMVQVKKQGLKLIVAVTIFPLPCVWNHATILTFSIQMFENLVVLTNLKLYFKGISFGSMHLKNLDGIIVSVGIIKMENYM